MIEQLPRLSQAPVRCAVRQAANLSETQLLETLIPHARLTTAMNAAVRHRARALVTDIREQQRGQGGIDALLQEFSLSTEEGIVLMCLAEALLRIPDNTTVDRMIRDKLAGGDWAGHLGQSESLFVNASAWGLLLTGKVVGSNLSAGHHTSLLEKTFSRLGEPVVRSAMRYAMRIMGAQFVLGQDIGSALERAQAAGQSGFTFSYDMLGEGARTMTDADRYHAAYLGAIKEIGRSSEEPAGSSHCPTARAGISVKLSALHPRYEIRQTARVVAELLPRVMVLVLAARHLNIGFTIDAEESWRLDLSLEVIEQICADSRLADWQGFGFAVQAYQKSALEVVKWAEALARRTGRYLGVRLVKGAYWDSEIKWAQEGGYSTYPVFTRKSATDLSYQACAQHLLAARDLLYPQFATHNAYSVATIVELARASGRPGGFEFQRLHGMGEELYHQLARQGLILADDKGGVSPGCRIYAPVGEHADLLAYLVRRLLENGANTSFVNNLQNRSLPIDNLLQDPVEATSAVPASLPLPAEIYYPHRMNSAGMNLADHVTLTDLSHRLASWWSNRTPVVFEKGMTPVCNPAVRQEVIGHVRFDDAAAMRSKLTIVHQGQQAWCNTPLIERAACLQRVADALIAEQTECLGLCIKEAGKTVEDSLAEIREAVDFCRYYAKEALVEEALSEKAPPLGTVLCISPWNFPVAIFLGQVAAALVTGNTVLAKPAEQTSLVARQLVALMYRCGVPSSALQLVLSPGAPVSEVLVSDLRVNGVVFTGSGQTAHRIARTLSTREGLSVASGSPGDVDLTGMQVPLIAETGGLNAMIVDSTALTEQVVDDVIDSAFHSAGQRCSALRLLYVQEDVADEIISRIGGRMAELNIGDPCLLVTDVGPVIDPDAGDRLQAHCDFLSSINARLVYQCPVSQEPMTDPLASGSYFVPRLYELAFHPPAAGEANCPLVEEVFGPILHVMRFAVKDLEAVLAQINATGFGLTLGVHSRIESRANRIAALARVGNVYINRNMVGAVVGVQPFGGRGKSGTGPKAGGPSYLKRLVQAAREPLLMPSSAAFSFPASEHDAEQSANLFLNPATHHHWQDDIKLRRAAGHWSRQTLGERIMSVEAFLSLLLAVDIAPSQHASGKALSYSPADKEQLRLATNRMSDWLTANTGTLALISPTGETNHLLWEARGIFALLSDSTTNITGLTGMIVACLLTGNGVQLCSGVRPFWLDALQACLAQVKPLAHLVSYQAQVDLAHVDGLLTGAASPHWFAACQRALDDNDALIPVVRGLTRPEQLGRLMVEKTITVNTTAAGGNASLMNG